MGLLKDIGRAAGGLFGGDFSSRAARAQAFLNEDYDGAARITRGMQEGEIARSKAESAAQQAASVRQGLKARGYNDNDINVIMANPDRASDLIYEALKTREFGPGGGSVRNVAPDGQASYEWAPRVDDDGSYWAAGPASEAPKLMREGVKTVPVAPGGSVAIIGATTGREKTREEVYGGEPGPKADPVAAAPLKGPQAGAVIDGYRFKGGDPNDPNAWEEVGGASQAGSRPFPR